MNKILRKILGKKDVGEEYITGLPMSEKKWTDKVNGLTRLLNAAKFTEQKAIDDQEELNFMISAMKKKIATFK